MSNVTKGDNSKRKEGSCHSCKEHVVLSYSTVLQGQNILKGTGIPVIDEKSISNKIKGDNSKSKKARVVILVHDKSSGPVLHFYQVS